MIYSVLVNMTGFQLSKTAVLKHVLKLTYVSYSAPAAFFCDSVTIILTFLNDSFVREDYSE